MLVLRAACKQPQHAAVGDGPHAAFLLIDDRPIAVQFALHLPAKGQVSMISALSSKRFKNEIAARPHQRRKPADQFWQKEVDYEHQIKRVVCERQGIGGIKLNKRHGASGRPSLFSPLPRFLQKNK